MAFAKDPSRQQEIVAQATVTYDLLTSGAYLAMIDLPVGAIVTGGFLAVTTLFNSASDDKFSIGDANDADEYAAQSADITATGRAAAVVPTGIELTSAGTVGIVWTQTGGSTSEGTARLVITYVVSDRENFTQG